MHDKSTACASMGATLTMAQKPTLP